MIRSYGPGGRVAVCAVGEDDHMTVRIGQHIAPWELDAHVVGEIPHLVLVHHARHQHVFRADDAQPPFCNVLFDKRIRHSRHAQPRQECLSLIFQRRYRQSRLFIQQLHR